MKDIVKNFGQFVNENDFDGMDMGSDFGRDGNVSLVDLLDCWVRENHANDTVLVLIDSAATPADLIDGGIEIKLDPTDREIGDAQYDGQVYAELYLNGRRSIEGEESDWTNHR